MVLINGEMRAVDGVGQVRKFVIQSCEREGIQLCTVVPDTTGPKTDTD